MKHKTVAADDCIDPILYNPMVLATKLPCDHVFGANTLAQLKKQACPFCRSGFDVQAFEPEYDISKSAQQVFFLQPSSERQAQFRGVRPTESVSEQEAPALEAIRALEQKREYRTVVEEYEKMLRRNPRNLKVLMNLAESAFQAKQYQKSLTYLALLLEFKQHLDSGKQDLLKLKALDCYLQLFFSQDEGLDKGAIRSKTVALFSHLESGDQTPIMKTHLEKRKHLLGVHKPGFFGSKKVKI